MPRRGNVPKREVLPDPQYNSVLVTKLVNSVMLDGKKGVAQKVVYGAFEIVETKTVGDTLWGHTGRGWVGMGFVRMDSTPPLKEDGTPAESDLLLTQGQQDTIASLTENFVAIKRLKYSNLLQRVFCLELCLTR